MSQYMVWKHYIIDNLATNAGYWSIIVPISGYMSHISNCGFPIYTPSITSSSEITMATIIYRYLQNEIVHFDYF